MTHIGKCLTARGIKPVVRYQHRFANTYLYGSYSPITGDSFVYEIEVLGKDIFHKYLSKMSEYKPKEFKIVVIDNASFHSTLDIELPQNIVLVPIPPYTPELNPCEKIWQYIKDRFKNKNFKNIALLKEWLHKQVVSLDNETIKSITHNENWISNFNTAFYT